MAQYETTVPQFNAESWEETARIAYRFAAEKGEQLIGLHPDGTAIISEDAMELPDALPLDDIDPALNDAAALAESLRWARKNGVTLTNWDRLMREPTFTRMLPVTRRLRQLVAEETGKDEHEVSVHVEWSNERADAKRVLMRLPRKADPEKVGPLIPGWSSGWTIEQDTWTGITTFTWGPKRVLPVEVALTEMPMAYDRENWFRPAFGMDEHGSLVRQNISDTAHTLISGESGSGKTVTINALVSARLLAGHRLIIIDPTKGLDFPSFLPYALCLAENYAVAHAAMQWLLDENNRRRTVLKKHGKSKLGELPMEVRDAEDFHPLTVVGDELASLLRKREVTANLAKDSPLRKEQELERDAVALLDAGFNKLAAVGRSQGIHLILATQQAKEDAFGSGGTTLRTNLGNSIFLHSPNAGVNLQNVKFLFDTKSEQAIELLDIFDEGVRGLAITMGEVGAPRAVRVAKADSAAVTAVLEAAGVPKATPLDFTTAATASSPTEPDDPWA